MKQASTYLVVTGLWTSYDYLSLFNEQDDIVVGGVLNFQMYSYPESCETKFRWTMRAVYGVDEQLFNIPFPENNNVIVDNPVPVEYQIPSYVFMSKDVTTVKIGVWDGENKCWNTDKIGGDCEPDQATRKISFTTQ